MYFTDRGIEELESRRGEEEVTLAWLADQLRTFVDLNPGGHSSAPGAADRSDATMQRSPAGRPLRVPEPAP
ncbi:DUF6104 family protein [Streptomyces rimosus]|uniref:DUF6104 family protein n=1 Tax=Streptomyces rimosus TaxID=1927 RepID=UPI002D21844B|nr:DUF6104 family protein [Streptomyces rimosus]